MEGLNRHELVEEGLLTIAEAEKFTGLKKSTLYKLMERGDIPYAKIGSARRIPKVGLAHYLQKCLITNDEDQEV